MTLEQRWTAATATATQRLTRREIITAMTHESNSDLRELTRRIRYQRNYAQAFLAGFVVLAPFVASSPVTLACLLIVAVVYAAGAWSLHAGYRQLARVEHTLTDTHSALAHRLAIVQKTLRVNHLWGAISMPTAIACAVLGGYALSTGADYSTILSDASFLLTAAITFLVLLPLAIWAGDRLTKAAFGDLVDGLRQNLLAIERLGGASDRA